MKNAMVAHEDIDALLISALYGELTPADEARLSAHLESHPTDRSALDDLTRARDVVRESRIFAVQLEPPQAISALLLQEAARRAPKKVAIRDQEQDWFHRFVQSFMRHPAMAAAAMLVVVVGVAGTLYMRKGADAQFAEERVAAPAATAQLAEHKSETEQKLDDGISGKVAATTPPADHVADKETTESAADGAARSKGGGATGGDVANTAAGSGSAYDVDLAESKNKQLDDQVVAQEQQRGKQQQDAKKLGSKSDAPARPAAHEGIVVQTPKTPAMTPKELPPPTKVAVADPTAAAPRDNHAAASDRADNTVAAQGAAGSGAAPGGAPAPAHRPTNGTVGYAPPTASPPPPQQTQPTQPTVPKANVRERSLANNNEKDADKNDKAASDVVAWAKDQHARVQAFVKSGKCQDAAKIAVDISTRAPEYYAQYVANDRTIKSCSAYIQQARDQEAEKSQKARAQKRVNANEPAPVTNDLK